MKIMYDHQIFFHQRYGGISRYFARMVGEMHSIGEDARIVAPIYRNNYLGDLPQRKVVGVKLAQMPTRLVRLADPLNRQISSRYATRFSPAIIHETYYNSKSFAAARSVRFLTVYDMISELFPNMSDPSNRGSVIKRLSVERADHIIAISQSAKNDLCELFNVPEEKVTVVYLGFDNFRSEYKHKTSLLTKRPFLLYVGTRSGYKNFEGLLRAVASDKDLRDNFDIIAFGGPPVGADEMKLVEVIGLRPESVHHLDGADAVLGSLYNCASAFVYPSKYEGFGLPPLEAMAHDCPVIVSNTSSIPEVVGGAGEYFDPASWEDQANAIRRVVFDEARRNELILLGRERLKHFSWARCAQETVDIYRRVLSQ